MNTFGVLLYSCFHYLLHLFTSRKVQIFTLSLLGFSSNQEHFYFGICLKKEREKKK